MFGMSLSAMSEVFWVYLRNCSGMYDPLFCTLRFDPLKQQAKLYAECISESGAPLPNFVGFMDDAKVFISGPGRNNVNPRSCYSGHKTSHCIVYLTITSLH